MFSLLLNWKAMRYVAVTFYFANHNSGLCCFIHDKVSASTSFLKLLSYRKIKSARIPPQAVAGFLAHGAVCWQANFIDGKTTTEPAAL